MEIALGEWSVVIDLMELRIVTYKYQ